ncbi:MAG: hypothetical protein IH621_18525, partial [Krumholzibacteria bacterium]|nr:hypothetical protein [Candidatus Krumholzibacteria bacterium]
MIRAYPALLAVVLGTSAAAAVEFTDHVSIDQHQCFDSAQLGDESLVLASDGLWLVDWAQPSGLRERCLVRRSLPAGSLHAWGDSLVALAPAGEGGHLVVHLGAGGEPVVEEIADPDWLPVQAWFGGRPWFLQPRDGHDLRLLPALGAGGDTLTVPESAGFDSHLVAAARQRLVLGLEYHGWGAAIRAWDMSDPEHPVAGVQTEVATFLAEMIVHEDVAYLATDYLQVWDVTDVAAPVHLADFGPAGYNRHLHIGPGPRLTSWFSHDFVRVIDIADPAAPRNVVIHTLSAALSPDVGGIAPEADRVLVRQGSGVRAVRLPAAPGGLVRELGWAWPILDSPIPPRMATDGRHVWIQRGERLVADLQTGSLVPCVDLELPAEAAVPRFLAAHRGHLLTVRADGSLVCEDAADPARPALLWRFAPAVRIAEAVLRGDDLAVRFGETVRVFDVSSPADQRVRGEVAIPTADITRMALADSVLFVAQAWSSGDYIYNPWRETTLRVFVAEPDAGIRDVAVVPVPVLHPSDQELALASVLAVGTDVYVYRAGTDFHGYSRCQAVRLDLGDPASPTVINHTWADFFPTPDNTARLATPTGEYLVIRYFWELAAAKLGDAEPSQAPVLATVPIPHSGLVGNYGLMAAASPDRIVLLRATGIDAYRLGGVELDDPELPPPPPRHGIAVAPNPFNPGTMLRFDVARPTRQVDGRHRGAPMASSSLTSAGMASSM